MNEFKPYDTKYSNDIFGIHLLKGERTRDTTRMRESGREREMERGREGGNKVDRQTDR